MKRTKFLLCSCLLLMLQHYDANSQDIIRLDSGNLPVICFAGRSGLPSKVPAPEGFLRGAHTNTRIQSASITVEYFGFSPEAMQAFEHATSIWESLLTSPVEIHVAAVWTGLPEGTLGSAGPSFWAANFEGTPKYNIYYPGPLAEKLAGGDLNDPDEYDVVAQFNSSAAWHFESTGTPDPGEFDFITVVLHELGHGLGFTSTFEVVGDVGLHGQYTEDGVPFAFDVFLGNGADQNLYEDFASPSTALASHLTGNDLFFKSPFDAETAKVFAPQVFSEGSSISHLDPGVYPQGTANSLMRPFVNPNEVNHDPGAVTQKIFSDMGWVTSYIRHDHLKDREDVLSPFEVKAVITADNSPGYTFLEDHVILTYSRSDVPGTTTLAMQPTGVPNEFATVMPAPMAPVTYAYSISVQDNLGRTLSSPGEFYDPQAEPGSKGPRTAFFTFAAGQDMIAPDIVHAPKSFISYLDEALVIDVEIREGNGISTALVEFAFNDEPLEWTDLTFLETESDVFDGTTVYRYRAALPIAPNQLQDGDQISYRILATDDAASPNEATLPATGHFNIPVEGLAPSRTYYINNFNEPSDDFIGDAFSIGSAAGFASPAIHSAHPYPEAGSGNQLNLTYQLRIPIIVSDESAFMSFDEVLIAEPGEEGSVFGDADFYDYASVEGSTDGGRTWTPLTDGYDSRDNPIWLSLYDASGAANQTHFRKRTIDLRDTFSPGDEVVLRFLLFSDAFGNAWGWIIDNLQIQVDDQGPEILHNHLDYLIVGTNNVSLAATVSDDQLIDEITLVYSIDQEVPQRDTETIMSKEALVDFSLDVSGLQPGQVINYRYEATDSAGNISALPPEGYFVMPILQFEETVDQYSNVFDAPSNDFVGNFFQVTQPAGFNSGAMHSSHPYPAGFGTGHRSDFAFTLVKKVRVSEVNPYMKFDEIVLVQPGAAGSVFGTAAFHDYVIVEASNDNGRIWHALQPGYDASSKNEWETAYDAAGPGTQQLVRRRGIVLAGSGDVVAGDEILIRFRLFSDESGNGWGWMIDNLHIQDEITGLEPDGLVSTLLVYPNPVMGDRSLIIETQATTNSHVVFSILDAQGAVVGKGDFPAGADEAAVHSLALEGYANGIYLLRMAINGTVITRKFIVAR